MSETPQIDDPTLVINTLAARIRELESALARQQAEQHAATPAQVAGFFRWLRARAVDPLYVGAAPDDKARQALVGDAGWPLITEEVAQQLLEEVRFLSTTPLPEEARDTLRRTL